MRGNRRSPTASACSSPYSKGISPTVEEDRAIKEAALEPERYALLASLLCCPSVIVLSFFNSCFLPPFSYHLSFPLLIISTPFFPSSLFLLTSTFRLSFACLTFLLSFLLSLFPSSYRSFFLPYIVTILILSSSLHTYCMYIHTVYHSTTGCFLLTKHPGYAIKTLLLEETWSSKAEQ